MGKNNKKGPKANVFKVAGAKSLKKSKAKVVNLGLKNIKQKVQDIDKEFIEINKTPKSNAATPKSDVNCPEKRPDNKVTREEISSTTAKIVKMDL